MRELTLNEKINIKGKLDRKLNFSLPKLNMADALYFWSYCYGYFPIGEYYKIPNKVRKA